MQYFLVQLEGAPPDTGAAPPGFGGCTSFAPVLHPPALAVHPFCTPLAPSKVLDFGILPMYLSFQVHLWSSVLWMLEEYYSLSFYIVRVLDSDRKLEEILLESKLISLAQHRQKCDSPAELNQIFLKKECANFNVG